jgi:coenzyme F420-0:L-glutamate ligase/coenzyme F420-1:gamma-L-glutamate ligase
MPAAPNLFFYAVPDLPLVEPGDDLAGLIAKALKSAGIGLHNGDVVVVAQKIVSKADGLYVALDTIVPSDRAKDLAAMTGKDPRHVEVVLSETDEIVKAGPHAIVSAHKRGFVMANAGIDESNIDHKDGHRVLLLPRDPDTAAAALKARLDREFGVACGVVINDSFGRPWRNGVVGVALGAAGIPSLVDRIGAQDLFGRQLKATEIAIGDALASAASLLMGEADEGLPVVLVRGYRNPAPERPASALIRARDRDMFR